MHCYMMAFYLSKMSIEIKFKGFSEELKSFVYGFYQEVDVEGVGYSYIFWQGHTTLVSADSVAQFTGLYDKNLKEIYQKDGIKTKWSKHKEIDFYVKLIDGTLTLVDDYDNPSEFHHLYDNVDFDYEVSQAII